jgi:hypothetical protein
MKNNKEVENKYNSKNNGWLLAYTEDSDFYISNALHIERNDELFLVKDDKQASIAAEKDGVKLIYGIDGVPDQVYVDTEENRKIIAKMLIKHPEYFNVHKNIA